MSNLARASTHDAAIRFRVAGSLLSTAEQKARRDGISLSELLRHALQRELRGAA